MPVSCESRRGISTYLTRRQWQKYGDNRNKSTSNLLESSNGETDSKLERNIMENLIPNPKAATEVTKHQESALIVEVSESMESEDLTATNVGVQTKVMVTQSNNTNVPITDHQR